MGKTIEKMRANPKGDWRISDVAKACAEAGANLIPPTGGSHYKVKDPARPDHLSIPARRPIKPVYIRKLVDYLDATETT